MNCGSMRLRRKPKNLTSIAGGKLTTYRVMAVDAVDHALGEAQARSHPSATADLPLVETTVGDVAQRKIVLEYGKIVQDIDQTRPLEPGESGGRA